MKLKGNVSDVGNSTDVLDFQDAIISFRIPPSSLVLQRQAPPDHLFQQLILRELADGVGAFTAAIFEDGHPIAPPVDFV